MGIFSKENLQKVGAFGKQALQNYQANNAPKSSGSKGGKSSSKKKPVKNSSATSRGGRLNTSKLPLYQSQPHPVNSAAKARAAARPLPAVQTPPPDATPKTTYTILGKEYDKTTVDVVGALLIFAGAAGITYKMSR